MVGNKIFIELLAHQNFNVFLGVGRMGRALNWSRNKSRVATSQTMTQFELNCKANIKFLVVLIINHFIWRKNVIKISKYLFMQAFSRAFSVSNYILFIFIFHMLEK